MKNFIGGLFNNQDDAERARQALQENGLQETSINLLQCTHDKEAVMLEKNPSIKSIGKGALNGALILGGIGGVVGLLVGLGVIHVPSIEPSGGETLPFQISWQFIFVSVLAGMILGAWTGGIIGAAIRLARPQYRKLDIPQEANKGDLMLAVQANGANIESKVRSILKEYGAVRLEKFRDEWDPEVWSVIDKQASPAS